MMLSGCCSNGKSSGGVTGLPEVISGFEEEQRLGLMLRE